jgi:signal transduction histidine kinase
MGSDGRPHALDGVLYEVSKAVLAVARQLSVHEVLQVIVESATTLADARYGAIGVPDDDGGFAEFVVSGISEKQRAAIGPLPRQHGMLAAMLADEKPQRLDDVREDPRFGWWPKAHPVLADFLGVPIRDDEGILGIIYLANKRGSGDQAAGGFTEDDEELLTLFAAHAAIALTNARLYERERELTVVRERTRLARELHDAVAQKLFGIRLGIRTSSSLVPRDPDRAVAELERVQAQVAEALSELRAVIVELRPAQLADDGLMESLRKHITVLDRVYGPRVVFDPGEYCVCGLSPAGEATVFRIAQEALHNALRHAGAYEIRVGIRRRDGLLTLEVRDDGRGFDPDAPRGLGLDSMRERAGAVGARLNVESAPGTGTRVRLEVPCDG